MSLSRQRIRSNRIHPVVLSQHRFLGCNRLLTATLLGQSFSHVATENSRTWDFLCRDSAARTVRKGPRQRALPRMTGPGRVTTAPYAHGDNALGAR